MYPKSNQNTIQYIRIQLFNQKDAKITFSVNRKPKKTPVVLTELREVIAKYQTTCTIPEPINSFPTNPHSFVKRHIKHKLKN